MNTAANALHEWTFDELVREGLSLVPAHAPEWTNHNPSDPGVTLVELLAYFTEVLAYRLSRVTPDAKLQFLRLLKGRGWTGWKPLVGQSHEAIDRALDDAVRELSHHGCAVTAGDFETLAMHAAVEHLEASGQGGEASRVRALCIGGTDLQQLGRSSRTKDLRAHVTIVLVPERELDAEAIDSLCARVREELAAHCLLTTRLHVIGPVYLHVAIGFRLALRPGVDRDHALATIKANLKRRFGPRQADGGDGEARAPGRPVHMTEVLEVIDEAAGVDFVDDVVVSAVSRHASDLFDTGSRLGLQLGVHSTLGLDSRLGLLPDLGSQRLQRDPAGRLSSVLLQPWEVARLHLAPDAVSVIDPTLTPPDTGRARNDAR